MVAGHVRFGCTRNVLERRTFIMWTLHHYIQALRKILSILSATLVFLSEKNVTMLILTI